jgi:hypothetical protein
MSIHTLRTEREWKQYHDPLYIKDEKWYLINIYEPNEQVTNKITIARK